MNLVQDLQFLRKKCIPVEVNQSSLKILKRMHETFNHYESIGNPIAALAANNIGYLKNIIVVKNGNEFINMFNPEVVRSAQEQALWEACGCIPLAASLVKRPMYLEIDSLNEKGVEQGIKFKGVKAAYADHEIHHIRGIPMIDIAIKTEYFADDKSRYQAMLERNDLLLQKSGK